MSSNSPEVQTELARRYKSASTTVIGLLVATILLSVVAFLARPYLILKPQNSPLDFAVRIAVLMIGLGAIIWRRNKFAPMRLQDIAGLAGASGLLQTLEKTTIQIALFAVTITAIGFITTLLTGNDWYTYWTSAIAVILLVYGYPLKSTWNVTVQRFTQPHQEPVES